MAVTDADLAQQLIDTVRRTTLAEAAIERDRVAYALWYIEQLDRPNGNAVAHIRRILTGGYDNHITTLVRHAAEGSKAPARGDVLESKEN